MVTSLDIFVKSKVQVKWLLRFAALGLGTLRFIGFIFIGERHLVLLFVPFSFFFFSFSLVLLCNFRHDCVGKSSLGLDLRIRKKILTSCLAPISSSHLIGWLDICIACSWIDIPSKVVSEYILVRKKRVTMFSVQ